jgi:Transcriptional regulator, AbiEi antitoxin
MTIGIKKNELLAKLSANVPRNVSLAVVHAVVDHVHPILGVAFARYEKYAEVSASGLRTVARTIPALNRLGFLRKQSRRDGPPVLWLPEIMDMQAHEAIQRAAWLAHYEDENPQNYFTIGAANVAKRARSRRAGERARDEIEVGEEFKTTNLSNPSLETGTPQPELLEKRRAKAKSPARVNDQEILCVVHREWDAQGLTPQDPKALTKAIHAMGNSRPERLKNMDKRALRKAYQRAKGRLPVGYDRWIGLVEKWDKLYTRPRARDLVDRLVRAVGDRQFGILDKLFGHLERKICDHPPKKVWRLETECERLEDNEDYRPQLRSLKKDEFSEQVYTALADGPKTREQLTTMFGKTYGAISSVGRRLRNAGRIKTVWNGGEFMWAHAATAPLFIPARDAIVTALKKGPMTIPALARETGKGESTVKSALHRHLLNRTVTRSKFGTYAIAGTEPSYVFKGDAILGALIKGPMTFQELVREIGITPQSLPQFLERLRANGEIIRTRRGTYALPGGEQAYVPTRDAIIHALTKEPMKLGPLVKRVNKSTKSTRSRGTITSVLRGLIKQDIVKQDGRGSEYRLLRPMRAVRKRGS